MYPGVVPEALTTEVELGANVNPPSTELCTKRPVAGMGARYRRNTASPPRPSIHWRSSAPMRLAFGSFWNVAPRSCEREEEMLAATRLTTVRFGKELVGSVRTPYSLVGTLNPTARSTSPPPSAPTSNTWDSRNESGWPR